MRWDSQRHLEKIIPRDDDLARLVQTLLSEVPDGGTPTEPHLFLNRFFLVAQTEPRDLFYPSCAKRSQDFFPILI